MAIWSECRINLLFAKVPLRSSIVFDYADENLFKEKGVSNRVENIVKMDAERYALSRQIRSALARLPEHYGSWKSVYTCFRRWQIAGIWNGILKHVSITPDLKTSC